MLKFEHIKPTRVRAYDFEPMEDREDRYVEGVVVEHIEQHGAKFLVVRVEKDTVFPDNPRNEVLVPMELGFGEYDNRVEVL